MHYDWPDDALYQGLIERDAGALEALIRRYSREMSYFIRLVLDGVGTPQDAEECANDLFVAVWLEIESFDAARGSLRTWITMRAKYIALDLSAPDPAPAGRLHVARWRREYGRCW